MPIITAFCSKNFSPSTAGRRISLQAIYRKKPFLSSFNSSWESFPLRRYAYRISSLRNSVILSYIFMFVKSFENCYTNFFTAGGRCLQDVFQFKRLDRHTLPSVHIKSAHSAQPPRGVLVLSAHYKFHTIFAFGHSRPTLFNGF